MSQPIWSFSTVATPAGPAVLAAFEIPGGACTPDEFSISIEVVKASFVPPPGHGLILSGRGPVWGYAMAAHTGHPSSWLATVDPRLGAVVVATHTPGVAVGQTIPLPS